MFFNNYSKPGPGIYKNAPKKPAIVEFFETVGRKFFEMMKLNLLNLVLSIPAIFVLYSIYLQEFVKPQYNEMTQAFTTTIFLIFCVAFMAVIGFVPVQVGTTYMFTQYSIENPTFFMHDFFGAIKKNIKQALIVTLVDAVVLYLMLVNYKFYSSELASFHGAWFLRYIVTLAGIIYAMMHFYIYPIMFTYVVGVRELFKKSFLMTMIALPQNALMALITVGIPFIFMLYPAVISYIILFVIGLPFIQFMISFFTNRIIKKYIHVENEDELKKQEEIEKVCDDTKRDNF